MHENLEYVGVAEASEILGWSKGRVSEYLRRGNFPEPAFRLAMGPVWRREQIEQFKREQEEEGLDIDAYFCEWEEEGACTAYPVRITTRHSASSYRQPVVVIDGEARGPGEMPAGELQLPAAFHAQLAPRLRKMGYQVCASPVDERWLERWEQGEEADHWHPEARRVRF